MYNVYVSHVLLYACIVFIQHIYLFKYILLLQEHWLWNNGVMRLSEAFPKHHVYCKSGIIVDELLFGRPYGGVAIFLNKNMKCFISEVDWESKRVCVFYVNLMNILFYLYQCTSM